MKENQQVSAVIIADSISPQGKRITTFELEYPRIIHSELMTHRLFSRNAMSSRAVPIAKMIDQVLNNPAMPVRFGANQPGMQDKGGEHNEPVLIDWQLGEEDAFGCRESKEIYGTARDAWKAAAKDAAQRASYFAKAGYHKQIANRLLEPFQRMKAVFTATDMNNFWWLRIDADADPTIEALVKEMKRVFDDSNPESLQPGEWHTPYVDHVYEHKTDDGPGIFVGYCIQGEEDLSPVMLTKEEAIAISASCCAQVSYRILNSTKEKALDIYQKLISGNKVHASPFEHQATPMLFNTVMKHDRLSDDASEWEEGITHVDLKLYFWSGNFCGWIQNRQLLSGHSISG